MSLFDDAVAGLWPAFKQAGMLSVAMITSGGTTFVIDVGFSMPDMDRLGRGVLSRDYEIEYQHADAPELAEDDAVVIDGVTYRVREAPYIPHPGNAADGIFRCALLTKV